MGAVDTPTKWAQSQVAFLPVKWQGHLLSQWRKAAKPHMASHWREGRRFFFERCGEGERDANIALRNTVARLKSTRLPIAAEDADIRERAAFLAGECRAAAIAFCNRVMYADGVPLSREELLRVHGEDWAASLAVELRATAAADGVSVPWDRRKDRRMKWGGVARMMCESWWRRQLRAQHAKAVEGAAIALGFVNRARECYASDETVIRRAQQNRRNAATLERTILENEEGEQFTLAELAAKSVANKRIRRGELMTRIAGLERIAKDLWHGGVFTTTTCPSRMHKWSTVKGSGKVYQNPKYDGTLPREAQAYLGKVWARTRSALHRAGIKPYGFRIAEPNHDGTPHWHMLLFVEPDKVEEMLRIMAKYAKQDSQDEAGAGKHRFKAVVIDWAKGSAAGYIAKYVAKNIDGMYIQQDLLGNDAMHASARVEAWAAAWGIRQFQPIGGAPVTVWRELRRIKELPEDAPEHLRKAWEACNKIAPGEDGEEGRGADFGAYVEAQGGPLVGRDYRIRIARKDREGEGVYGEALPPAPVGVETIGQKRYMIGRLEAVNNSWRWLVESVRRVWRVVGRGFNACVGSGLVLGPLAAPWTRVNNCTRDKPDPEQFGPGFFNLSS